jgi:pSer/pThr/pTyr-binding forkhead associated (FHA) protein
MADDESKSTDPAKERQEPASQPSKPAGETAPARSAIEMEQERLLQAAQSRMAAQATEVPTHRLEQEAGRVTPQVTQLPFGTEAGSAQEYTTLPAKPPSGPLHDVPRWRIELHGLRHGEGPLGLDVVGDVVLGRGSVGENAPDLDMEPYGAFQLGVSRRHAMLRPTKNALYIIDLNSTNGTLHNALRLGSGVTRALRHNDNITLGQFTFTVKIIEEPGAEKPEPVRESAGAAQPGADERVVDKDKTGPLNPKVVDTDSTPLPGTKPSGPPQVARETTQPLKPTMLGGSGKLPEPVARLVDVPERPGQSLPKPAESDERTPIVKIAAVPLSGPAEEPKGAGSKEPPDKAAAEAGAGGPAKPASTSPAPDVPKAGAKANAAPSAKGGPPSKEGSRGKGGSSAPPPDKEPKK